VLRCTIFVLYYINSHTLTHTHSYICIDCVHSIKTCHYITEPTHPYTLLDRTPCGLEADLNAGKQPGLCVYVCVVCVVCSVYECAHMHECICVHHASYVNTHTLTHAHKHTNNTHTHSLSLSLSLTHTHTHIHASNSVSEEESGIARAQSVFGENSYVTSYDGRSQSVRVEFERCVAVDIYICVCVTVCVRVH
jgi:hypothetical protein